MTGKVLLCALADAPTTSPRQIAHDDDRAYALYQVEGKFFLTDDLCTHGLFSLSQGDLEGDRIYCPLHGGAFDVRTGRAVEPPCIRPLRTYPVVVEEGLVFGILD